MMRSMYMAIAGMALLGGSGSAASQPLPTVTYRFLPLGLAVEAAQAAIATCKAEGHNIAVTIVDRGGNLKLAFVADGAEVIPDVSYRKAYTAATRRMTTIELADAVAMPGAFNPTLYDSMMVTAGGGVPIKAGNEFIGGIGVGGAPAGETDERCARAGLARIADRLK